MAHYYLSDFENAIKKSYEEHYGVINENDIHSLAKSSHICNTVLYAITQSYYFEKKYQGFKLFESATSTGLGFTYISSPFQKDLRLLSEDKLNDRFNYHIQNGIYIKKILEKSDFFSHKLKNNIEYTPEVQLIIDDLSNNSYYAKIFEKNPLKQQLHLKSKNDLQFSIIEGDITLENISKLIKEQSFTSIAGLEHFLNTNNGLTFVNIEKQQNDTWFIYHNDEDIAAIGSIMKNPFVNPAHHVDKFKYLGFIAVNYDYRGHNLGTKISNSIIDYCAEKQYFYESSQFTDDGSLYLKSKMHDYMLANSDKVPVLKNSYLPFTSDYINNNLKEDNYEVVRTHLISKIKEIHALEQSSKKITRADLTKVFKPSKIKNKII